MLVFLGITQTRCFYAVCLIQQLISKSLGLSQALPLEHTLRCWWEGLMLLKGFAGENIFLRRNKWGMKFPLNLFTSQGCRANVSYKSLSLLAWLCLIASATLNICSDLHPSWQAWLMDTSGISFMWKVFEARRWFRNQCWNSIVSVSQSVEVPCSS